MATSNMPATAEVSQLMKPTFLLLADSDTETDHPTRSNVMRGASAQLQKLLRASSPPHSLFLSLLQTTPLTSYPLRVKALWWCFIPWNTLHHTGLGNA